jgi:hypothetical protein
MNEPYGIWKIRVFEAMKFHELNVQKRGLLPISPVFSGCRVILDGLSPTIAKSQALRIFAPFPIRIKNEERHASKGI